MSDINIGAILEALNNKADAGHQVVAFQAPTAQNNYTWYRLYADGWVEQGGRTATNISQATITLPVEMADTEYSVIATTRSNSIGSGGFDRAPGSGALTTTDFKLEMAANANYFSIWQVSGMAA